MSLTAIKQFLSQNQIDFCENESVKPHTTFKIGGAADLWVTPDTTAQVASVSRFCREYNIPLTVIGKGSNLLVSDYGIEGVVLNLSRFNLIKMKGPEVIYCEAGAVLTNLCNFALQNSLSGIEFAYGIPGSVGGAVYMNAGAYGGEIKDTIISATVLTANGEIKTVGRNEMALDYRTSVFKTDGSIILSAEFALKSAEKKNIKAAMDDFMSRRKAKQPLEYPSAGSTFKRPEGNFAGALIEKADLKGFSIGDATVSEKHAGFVINKGSATCSEVKALISHIQQTVKAKSGIMLEPEVIFVGKEKA